MRSSSGPGLAHRLEAISRRAIFVTLDREALRSDIADPPPQPNPLELNVIITRAGAVPLLRQRPQHHDQRIARRALSAHAGFPARGIGGGAAGGARTILPRQLHGRSIQIPMPAAPAFTWSAGATNGRAIWRSAAPAGAPSIRRLYLIELDVDIKLPRRTATLTSDYFSWLTLDRIGLTDNGTDNFSLFEEQGVEFLFHPLPGLAHGRSDALACRGGSRRRLRPVAGDVELYNWISADAYDVFDYRAWRGADFRRAARLTWGPGNARCGLRCGLQRRAMTRLAWARRACA